MLLKLPHSRSTGAKAYTISLTMIRRPVKEWLPAVAEMLGAKPPFHVPAWLARIAAGKHLVVMMTESRAGSNAKAKRELVWRRRAIHLAPGIYRDRSAQGSTCRVGAHLSPFVETAQKSPGSQARSGR